ncbi:DNA repair protein [Mammaliicoccus stepanovicii]|uniref:ImpB/MucB/SamB family protein n=1 Tax=Mammaliicoccus stepanovicii TaxID=643214 RepID=A0A239ZCY3_9STAP|nr:DNA repair protein [Mammaliicoccus stepanovicii]PNZ74136.1 DNA repair protein [Mammaliicoccus stepanovicii]GGI42070.1 DNA repair protein MucB [Mammaliicoccus stepanovicii]SNV68568.1 ImpB/MucB/SamB family protein [Mammaliicoccus stepanovicii]
MFDNSLYEQRNVLCIDLGDFFASVSCISKGLNPQVDKLAVISNTKKRGAVVLAATQGLQDIGVKVGSRLFELPQRNDIYIINPNMKYYVDFTNRLYHILFRYVTFEDIYQYDINEIFIDFTDYIESTGKNLSLIAEHIQTEIKEACHIQCLIGIGPNMLLSKVSKDVETAFNSETIIEWDYQDIRKKLWAINSLSTLWGINERVEQLLNNCGIFTVGDIALMSQASLSDKVGLLAKELQMHANGIDVNVIGKAHSIERPNIHLIRNFEYEYHYLETKHAMLELVEEATNQLRHRDLLTTSISFTMDYMTDGEITKTYTLRDGTNLSTDIFKIIWSFASELCDKHAYYKSISIALNTFIPARARELNLFINEYERLRNESILKMVKDSSIITSERTIS